MVLAKQHHLANTDFEFDSTLATNEVSNCETECYINTFFLTFAQRFARYPKGFIDLKD